MKACSFHPMDNIITIRYPSKYFLLNIESMFNNTFQLVVNMLASSRRMCDKLSDYYMHLYYLFNKIIKAVMNPLQRQTQNDLIILIFVLMLLNIIQMYR